MFVHSDEVEIDPMGRLHTFCHAVHGKWHMMGVNLTAGGSLQWFAETLCREAGTKKQSVYDILNEEAAQVATGSEGLFFLRVTGAGTLVVSAFGALEEVAVDGELVVDSGHVVAFEESLTYSLGKAGGSWLQSFLGGEGVVLRFRGRGRLLVQSHNRSEFGRTLGGRLPPRES